MLAVMWDVTDVPVLIVGGGTVGMKKVATMAAAEADVTVVDPRPSPAAANVRWVCSDYGVGHLAGQKVVIACASEVVNARVVADAKAAGLWVCSASDPTAGTFTFPAAVRHGPLTVAVGTDGASPAFARRLRDRLAGQLDETHGGFVTLLGEVRRAARTAVSDPAKRRSIIDALSDFSWLDRFRRDGPEITRAAMDAVIRDAR